MFDDVIVFFDERFLRDGNGGQISPNVEVISSIIDWFGSIGYDEWHDEDDDDDGGVRRLTIDTDIELVFANCDGGDVEIRGGINGQVDKASSSDSRWIILTFDDEEVVDCLDNEEHVQWESEVIVFNSVNRIGMWWDDDDVNDRSSWESLSNWSFGSKSETCWWKSKSKWDGMWWNVVVFTCVIEECGRICCIYERRIATGIELWHWR